MVGDIITLDTPCEIPMDEGWEVNEYGYMRISRNGKQPYAHRWRYEQEIGPIPEGKQLDHLCNNPRCWNPQHLEPVTNRENRERAAQRKFYCLRGHPLFGDNMTPTKTGRRSCKACARVYYHQRKRRDSIRRVRQYKEALAYFEREIDLLPFSDTFYCERFYTDDDASDLGSRRLTEARLQYDMEHQGRESLRDG